MRKDVAGLASVMVMGLFVVAGCGGSGAGGKSASGARPGGDPVPSSSTTAAAPNSAQSGATVRFDCAPLRRLNAVTGLRFTIDHPEKDACVYDVVTNGGSVGLVAGWPVDPGPDANTVAYQRLNLQATGLFKIRDAAAFFGSGAFWSVGSSTCAVYGPSGGTVYDVQLSVNQPASLGGHSACAEVSAAAHLLLRR